MTLLPARKTLVPIGVSAEMPLMEAEDVLRRRTSL